MKRSIFDWVAVVGFGVLWVVPGIGSATEMAEQSMDQPAMMEERMGAGGKMQAGMGETPTMGQEMMDSGTMQGGMMAKPPMMGQEMAGEGMMDESMTTEDQMKGGLEGQARDPWMGEIPAM